MGGILFFLKTLWERIPGIDEKVSLIVEQQRSIFFFTMFLVVVCWPIYIVVLDAGSSVYYILNGGVLIAFLVVVIGYFTSKISLNTAFSALLLSLQTEITLEQLYCAMDNGYTYQRLLIISNMLLSLMFVMMSVCAYRDKLAFIQSAISLLSYVLCVFLTHGPFLTAYLPLFIAIFVLMPLLGKLLRRNVYKLQEENDALKEEERKVLKSLQFSREELYAFMELIAFDTREERAVKLLDKIGEKARNNLFAVTQAHLKAESSQMEIVRNVFPELSPSELEICRLILQDKTVGEICELLGKSSGNITSQRVHIRSKLGLAKGDSLKKILQERMQVFENENFTPPPHTLLSHTPSNSGITDKTDGQNDGDCETCTD